MSLSERFMSSFEQMVQQAKESVCKAVCEEIDVKSKTFLQLFIEEASQQQDALLGSIIGNVVKAKQMPPNTTVVVHSEPGTSHSVGQQQPINSNNSSANTVWPANQANVDHLLNIGWNQELSGSQNINSHSGNHHNPQQQQSYPFIAQLHGETSSASVSGSSSSHQAHQGVLIEEVDVRLDEDGTCKIETSSADATPARKRGRPRKGTESSVKRPKPSSTAGRRRSQPLTKATPEDLTCNFCGKRFERVEFVRQHERIHTNVRPYECKWPDCTATSKTLPNLTKHIRNRHFGLSMTVAKQKELGIVDERDPMDWVVTREELL